MVFCNLVHPSSTLGFELSRITCTQADRPKKADKIFDAAPSGQVVRVIACRANGLGFHPGSFQMSSVSSGVQ